MLWVGRMLLRMSLAMDVHRVLLALAKQHTTHIHSQAHSQQRATHPQHTTRCHSTKLI